MQTQMSGNHQRTYDAVFQHPIARNLQWRDIRSMLVAMTDVTEEEHDGNVKFTRNRHTITIHPPQRKDFSDVQELMKIRHFLEQSSAVEAAPGAGAGVH